MAKQINVGPAEGPGASAGARQQNAVCKKARELINDMRADIYLAVRLDEFVRLVADSLDAPVTADDVKACIRHDDTVKIIKMGNAEVLWLWNGWYYHRLVDSVVYMTLRRRAVLAEAERHDIEGL
jgi:hypothetical protein